MIIMQPRLLTIRAYHSCRKHIGEECCQDSELASDHVPDEQR